MEKGKKIYVGCGENTKEGYLGCDIRRLPNVSVVCKAWEVDLYFAEAEEIYSRHMLEHLTLSEALHTIKVWYSCLKKGGKIVIITPNMDFHIQQYLQAEWNDEQWNGLRGNARHAFAGFWGYQRETEDLGNKQEKGYWDVHKSGYNQKSMRFFLKNILPVSVDIDIKVEDQAHLVTVLTKKNNL